jgi:hypothetical protein
LKDTGAKKYEAWKAIQYWNEHTTFAQTAKGKRFFPLDHKLHLRQDHWSEGTARVAVRQGLLAKSFDLAASAYEDAVGSGMSGDSLRRLTEGWGEQLEESRKAEAEQVYAEKDPVPVEKAVSVHAPIKEQANISTDGGMILLREEGWKEVKMSVVSAVSVKKVAPTLEEPQPDPKISLSHHSYQVGLWDADQMGQHQYLEGSRRQIRLSQRLGSVNDGAVWIDRITTTNFSRAVQVIDWGHASERLWKVANASFGDGSKNAKTWAEQQQERLWHGRIPEVVSALKSLPWSKIQCNDDIRNSPDYFETRQAKMSYDQFRQAGYPIGSGTVESGVNTVVHHRMKRQGRGWKRQHAQSLLAALSEFHSGRFQAAWRAHLPV